MRKFIFIIAIWHSTYFVFNKITYNSAVSMVQFKFKPTNKTKAIFSQNSKRKQIYSS